MMRRTRLSLVFLFALLLTLSFSSLFAASPSTVVVKGGPPSDGRENLSLGKLDPQVDFDTVSNNDGVTLARFIDGDVVRLDHSSDPSAPMNATVLAVSKDCYRPIYDRDGVTAYDDQGRLTHWVGTRSIRLSNIRFNDPVLPAFSYGQVVYGGGNMLAIANRTGKSYETKIPLPTGKKVTSAALTTWGDIYLTAKNAGGSECEKAKLYVARPLRAKYQVNETGYYAEQVSFSAGGHLAVVEKWGVASYLASEEGIGRDEILVPAPGPFVLAGCDARYCYIVQPWGLTAYEMKHDGFPQ